MGYILFLCIIVSLAPVLFSAIIIPGLEHGIIFQIFVGVMFIVQTLIIFFYFILFTTKKFDGKLLFFTCIFVISQAITLYISLLNNIQVNYLDLINIISRFVGVFIFLCIPSRLCVSQEGYVNFMRLVVRLGIIACIYNLLANFDVMANILSIGNAYEVDIKSFYLSRNGFAQLIFISIIANTFLWINKRSRMSKVNYIILLINLMTTLSRTALAAIIIFILVVYAAYSRRKVLTVIMISAFAFLFFLFVVSNQEISRFIIDMIIRKNVGTSGRSDLWTTGIQILNSTNWVFGVGYITSIDFIRSMGYSLNEFHNFYVETLVGGGLADLLLHFLIFGFALRRILTIYRNDRNTGIVYLSGYIALMVYAFFESVSFFSMGYVGTFFTIFFITIPILYSNGFYNQNSSVYTIKEELRV